MSKWHEVESFHCKRSIMPLAYHLTLIIYLPWMILIYYWFDIVVIVAFRSIIAGVSQRAFELGTPKVISTCLVVPSIVRGCQTPALAFEV